MSPEVMQWTRLVLLFGPALGLGVVGFMVALRSGELGAEGTTGASTVVSNLSRLVVRLLLWVIGLAIVGEVVGLWTVMRSG